CDQRLAAQAHRGGIGRRCAGREQASEDASPDGGRDEKDRKNGRPHADGRAGRPVRRRHTAASSRVRGKKMICTRRRGARGEKKFSRRGAETQRKLLATQGWNFFD